MQTNYNIKHKKKEYIIYSFKNYFIIIYKSKLILCNFFCILLRLGISFQFLKLLTSGCFRINLLLQLLLSCNVFGLFLFERDTVDSYNCNDHHNCKKSHRHTEPVFIFPSSERRSSSCSAFCVTIRHALSPLSLSSSYKKLLI